MKLSKQIKLLSWGTPLKVDVGSHTVYSGLAKEALGNELLKKYLDSPIKTIRLDTAVSPVVQIIIQNGGIGE